jgi:protein-tyrosine phosphatase
MNILFVCTGNICRSPIAEALMKKKYEDLNIEGTIDSAGFSPTTINEPPDHRAIKAARKKGIELSGSSRLFSQSDFDSFDRIYVMDAKNYNDVKDFSRNKKDMSKVDYLMNIMEPGTDKTIPDPIHSGTITFDDTINLIDTITTKIAEEIS